MLNLDRIYRIYISSFIYSYRKQFLLCDKLHEYKACNNLHSNCFGIVTWFYQQVISTNNERKKSEKSRFWKWDYSQVLNRRPPLPAIDFQKVSTKEILIPTNLPDNWFMKSFQIKHFHYFHLFFQSLPSSLKNLFFFQPLVFRFRHFLQHFYHFTIPLSILELWVSINNTSITLIIN